MRKIAYKAGVNAIVISFDSSLVKSRSRWNVSPIDNPIKVIIVGDLMIIPI